MVHDALRTIEDSGTTPDEWWMNRLKEAATSVLGTHLGCRCDPYSFTSFDFVAASVPVRRH